MNKKILLGAVAGLAASAASAGDVPEAVWQSLHLVDVAQSIHGAASDLCYKEGDYLTKNIVGEHPSTTSVVAWGVGFAAIHYGVSAWLSDHAPHWLYITWQSVSIADTAYSVGHNYSVGIRIGRPNTDYPACPQWARGTPP